MTWRHIMQSRIRYKADSVEEYVGIADECFLSPLDDWRRACLEPSERGARKAEFNAYLAEGLHGSLEEESLHVRWLRHCLADLGNGALLDGRLMLELIAEHTYGANAAELQRREHAFKSKVYFTDSMSGPEARAAFTEFIADHRLLPDHARGGAYKTHIDMICKLPPSCAKLREKYLRKMYQEQARGLEGPSITLKDLLELAIVDIMCGQSRSVHIATPATSTQSEVLQYDRSDRQRRRPTPTKSVRTRQCTICGENDHDHMQCINVCKSCGVRRCPGAKPGKACAVKSKTRPRQLTDALGGPMSAEAYSDVLAAWRRENPREAEAEKQARREAREARKPVRYTSCESEEDDGQDYEVEAGACEEYGVSAYDVCDQGACTMSRAYEAWDDDSASDEDQFMHAVFAEGEDDDTSEAVYIASTTTGDAQLHTNFLVDSGASIHLFQSKAMRDTALELPADAPMGHVNGIGGRSEVSAVLGAQLYLEGGVNIAVRALYAGVPEGAKTKAQDILSTAKLYDDTGIITMLDPKPHLLTPAGTCVPLERQGRYYMLKAKVAPLAKEKVGAVHAALHTPSAHGSKAEIPMSDIATAAALSSDENEMWAARLHLSSRGLRKLVGATTGTGIKSISHRMALIADSCTYRALSIMRRQPVPRGHVRVFSPGQCFEYDPWGPAGAASVNGGERFDLHAVCVATGYAHAKKATNHVARTVIDFISEVIASERAFGHTVLIVRMDRAPEHESAELAEGMRALKVQLELTPRNHHEGVSRAESGNQTTQCMAEASTRRAGLTLGHILDARIYAWRIRNLKCAAGRARTRLEEHTGVRPDLSRLKPYLYGTKCAVLQDEAARGPKGSLHAPRSLLGTFIGIEGASYLVRLDNGAGVVRQRSITPLNERQLMLRGMPPSVVKVDGASQTGRQLVQDASRPSYFPARTPAEDGAPPELIGPPSMRTRSAAGAQHRIMTIAHNMSASEDAAEARSMFNAAVFQMLGDEASEMAHCDDAEAIDEAEAMLSAVQPTAHLEAPEPPSSTAVYKASQSIVMVKTPMGMREERVPSSCRQVFEHPQRLQWEMADKKALDVLLRAGNVMVRLDSPEAEGAVMAHAVVQRKIKLDASTGELAKHDAYKSRICVDGRRLKIGMSAIGLESLRPMHAQVADDITIKMLLAKVAHARGTLVKIDIVNAYAKGIRGDKRAAIIIRMPETVREFDDDGAELYMLALKPMQGEEPSGDEWWHHINEALTSFGAHKAESVGGLYSGTIQGASFGIALITDDLLVGQWGGEDYEIGRRLRRLLQAKYEEIKYEEGPTSFISYKISYDRNEGRISLYMTQKVLEAVREYLPQLLQGVRPSASLEKGQTLERLADELKLPPAEQRRARLDKNQRKVQSIIGSIKFIEKVRVDLSLAMHRLSCVMSYPPDGALRVAELVLERAYDGRNKGITYGGVEEQGLAGGAASFNVRGAAPLLLQGVADATWGLSIDLYGVLITMNGGAVFHSTKKINVIMQSSMEAEGFATGKLGETIIYAREIAFALGIDLGGPTRCATDNSSNLQVSSGKGAANRTRHCQRRFLVSRQRVIEGSITLEHVKDEDNPADFLTKWLGAKKFKLSVAYATNSANAVKDHQ